MERISTIQTASVITQPTDATEPLTLIEKLEREVKRLSELKAKEKPDSLEYMFLGHHIVATVNAINIVEQHQGETCDWKMNDIGDWDYFNTSCGQAQYFGSDGITENNYKYCPFCGKPIKDITEYEVQGD